MADKKISELPIASAIDLSDISVLVSNGTDYQFDFTLLLQTISANVNAGSVFTFGTVVPQDNTGKNGDVFFKTDTVSFYQKINETWVLTRVIPTGSGPDGTMLYGIGEPGDEIGANNDSYIDTLTGIFYLKTSGAWSQVFSMATGPQGPQGTNGTNGANGTNGNTILHGTADPSNLTDGVDGDYYLNLSTYYFFGPKISGVWPDGLSLVTSITPNTHNRSFTSLSGFTVDWQNDIVIGTVTYAALFGNAMFVAPTVYSETENDDGTWASTKIEYNLTITRSADRSEIITVAFDWAVPLSGTISF